MPAGDAIRQGSPTSRRFALIIGNSDYEDATLSRLKTPEADAHALATTLRDPAVGSFDDVQEVLNQDDGSVRRAISAFFFEKKPEDMLLLYFSGHGVLDPQGRLYLAVKNTQRNLLKATAIPASFVSENMDDCRSKRQVLVLDCCHSGAFARGTKGDAPAITRDTFAGSGYGRVVLTASDSTQYALEGDQVIEQASLSLFTNFLLEGLTTGGADSAGDGLITLDEWYDYAYERVRSETPRQTPRKWGYNQQGDLIIARNPRPVEVKPAELPERLRSRLASEYKPDRLEAILGLDELLKGDDPALALSAREALERLAAEDDSLAVRSKASEVLAGYPAWLEQKQEAERLAREKAEQERLERERLEQERAEQERLERERLEQERVAREKAEQERLALERAEARRLEQERLAKEEAERLEREKIEKEHLLQEQIDTQRIQRARLEQERLAMEKARAEQLEREKAAEVQRLEHLKLETERKAREKLAQERQRRWSELYLSASQAVNARRWQEAQSLLLQLVAEAPGYRDTERQLKRVTAELERVPASPAPAATGAAASWPLWKPVLVIALGWGIALVVLIWYLVVLIWYSSVPFSSKIISGAILGGSLLLSFRFTQVTLRREYQIAIFVLWLIGIPWLMNYSGIGVLVVSAGVLAGTVLALKLNGNTITWKGALAIFIGWVLGAFAGGFIGSGFTSIMNDLFSYSYSDFTHFIPVFIGGLSAGALGGGWMHWYLRRSAIRLAPSRTERERRVEEVQKGPVQADSERGTLSTLTSPSPTWHPRGILVLALVCVGILFFFDTPGELQWVNLFVFLPFAAAINLVQLKAYHVMLRWMLMGIQAVVLVYLFKNGWWNFFIALYALALLASIVLLWMDAKRAEKEAAG